MKFYLAPLEGITGYIYRNALEKYFPGTDRYFTPFIVPNQKRTLRTKELRDILPENNHVAALIPQILTSDAGRFGELAQDLQAYGYEEVNLNLGCPSGTVVSGKRGAGFLSVPDELDRFLDRIFTENDIRISIKTRIGMEDPNEAFHLLEIYNKYPLTELIIHPRTRQEFYRGVPHLEIFEELLPECKMPVCYNGNLLTVQDYERFCARFPQVERVMLGRGVIANPGIIQELKRREHEACGNEYKTCGNEHEACGNEHETYGNKYEACGNQTGEDRAERSSDSVTEAGAGIEQLRAFLNEIFTQYRVVFGDDNNAIYRMKEMWGYLFHLFEDVDRYAKKIRKAKGLTEYQCAVDRLLAECRFYGADAPGWNAPQR